MRRSVASLLYATLSLQITLSSLVAMAQNVVMNPAGDQVITQKAATHFQVTGGDPSRFDNIIAGGPVVDIRSCGAVGDGVTDDGPALRTCVAANPDRNFYFPATKGTNTASYYMSCKTPGGSPPDNFVVTFPSGDRSFITGMPGPQGTIISVASGCGFAHWIGPSPGGYGGGGAEGVFVLSTEYDGSLAKAGSSNGNHGFWSENTLPHLMNVSAQGFGGDCFLIDSSTYLGSDLWRAYDIHGYYCKGSGWHTKGSDSNVGVMNGGDFQFNQLWGVRAEATYGSVYEAVHTTANNHDAGSPSATVSGTATRAGGQTNVVLNAHLTGLIAGDDIVMAGCTDSSFNGLRYHVFSVTDDQHFSYYTRYTESISSVAAETASTSCTSIGYQPIGHVWAQNGIIGGPFYSTNNTIQHNIFIKPYAEANQPFNKYSINDLVLHPDGIAFEEDPGVSATLPIIMGQAGNQAYFNGPLSLSTHKPAPGFATTRPSGLEHPVETG